MVAAFVAFAVAGCASAPLSCSETDVVRHGPTGPQTIESVGETQSETTIHGTYHSEGSSGPDGTRVVTDGTEQSDSTQQSVRIETHSGGGDATVHEHSGNCPPGVHVPEIPRIPEVPRIPDAPSPPVIAGNTTA